MPDELARACAQFEAVLLKQMLTEAGVGRGMRLGTDDSAGDDSLDEIGAATGTDVVESMFAEAIAQAVSGADRTGLARTLETSLRGLAR